MKGGGDYNHNSGMDPWIVKEGMWPETDIFRSKILEVAVPKSNYQNQITYFPNISV